MTRGFRFNLAIALGMTAVSTGWALATGFALPPLDFFALQWLATAVFGGIALIYMFVRPNPQAVRLMLNLIAGFWYAGFAILFSYLCATADRPLIDPALAAADRALGIDWPGMVSWAAAQPWITGWARFIYDRPLSELAVIITLLAILGRPDRVEEFITCLMVSGIVTAITGAFLPADGGYTYFHIPGDVFNSLNAMVTPAYLDHFHALRDGTMRHAVTGDVRGLVAFPSYHTCFALLLSYAVRGYKFLLFPSLVLNFAVIATTPFIGAHYVTDVIGGFAVAGMAVWIVSLLYSGAAAKTRSVPQAASA